MITLLVQRNAELGAWVGEKWRRGLRRWSGHCRDDETRDLFPQGLCGCEKELADAADLRGL
jgi:hypothetical protein